VENCFEKNLENWVGKVFSCSDRLIIIKSVLTSLSMFILYFFEIPKGAPKRLDIFWSTFFWQGDGHNRKYKLTKWNIILDLGVGALDIKNKYLLSNWFSKILNEQGVWQEKI
jgi:hypothetical protein